MGKAQAQAFQVGGDKGLPPNTDNNGNSDNNGNTTSSEQQDEFMKAQAQAFQVGGDKGLPPNTDNNGNSDNDNGITAEQYEKKEAMEAVPMAASLGISAEKYEDSVEEAIDETLLTASA